MNNEIDLHGMGLHEEIRIRTTDKTSTTVLRVPGGWVYAACIFSGVGPGVGTSSVFVPLCSEFKVG